MPYGLVPLATVTANMFVVIVAAPEAPVPAMPVTETSISSPASTLTVPTEPDAATPVTVSLSGTGMSKVTLPTCPVRCTRGCPTGFQPNKPRPGEASGLGSSSD